MFRIAELKRVPFWFVALPDRPSAARAHAALRVAANREIPHSSGRPWLVGRWPESHVAIGEAGHTRVAVLGEHAVTSEQLATTADRLRHVADTTGSPAGSSAALTSSSRSAGRCGCRARSRAYAGSTTRGSGTR